MHTSGERDPSTALGVTVKNATGTGSAKSLCPSAGYAVRWVALRLLHRFPAGQQTATMECLRIELRSMEGTRSIAARIMRSHVPVPERSG